MWWIDRVVCMEVEVSEAVEMDVARQLGQESAIWPSRTKEHDYTFLSESIFRDDESKI
jgi:hypothetical protein